MAEKLSVFVVVAAVVVCGKFELLPPETGALSSYAVMDIIPDASVFLLILMLLFEFFGIRYIKNINKRLHSLFSSNAAVYFFLGKFFCTFLFG